MLIRNRASSGWRGTSILFGNPSTYSPPSTSSRITSYNNPAGTHTSRLFLQTAGNASTWRYGIQLHNDGTIRFGNTGEFVRISNTGDVGIGLTNPQANLHVDGRIRGETFEFTNFFAVGGSSVCAAAQTGYTLLGACTSLQQYKKDISNLNLGLNTILELQPKKFVWTEEMGGFESLGFIAEEVEQINPLLVQYRSYENGEASGLTGVNYNLLTAVLTKAIQEQQVIIEQQNRAITDLEAEMEEIKLMINDE